MGVEFSSGQFHVIGIAKDQQVWKMSKKVPKKNQAHTLSLTVIKNVNKSLAPPRGHENFFFIFSKIMILA